MIIYIILFVFLLFLLLISYDRAANRRIKNYRQYIFFICAAVLTLVACLRGVYVGQDTPSYMRLFHRIGNVPWGSIIEYSFSTKHEIGYIIYTKLVYSLFPYGQAATAANSILFAVFFYRFIRKYSPDPLFSLFMFFVFGYYQTSFNIVSNLIAAAFVYSCLDTFLENKVFKSAVVLLLAFFFHRATIILIVLFFAKSILLTKRRVLLMLAGSVVLYRLYRVFLPFLNLLVSSEYQNYINNTEGDNGVILFFHVMVLLYLLIFLYLSEGKSEMPKENIALNNTIHWMVLLEICAFVVSLAASKFSRVAYIFTPAFFLYIPEVIQQIENYRYRWILRLSLIFLMSAQYFLRLSINNIGNTIPYTFFFS